MENQVVALRERLNRLISLNQQDPDNVPLIGDLMNAYLGVGDVRGADRFITAELTRRPQEHRLRNWAAIAAMSVQDYGRAEKLASELMAAGEDAPTIRYNRAFALLILGQPDAAINLLAPVLPRWLECPPLVTLLARAYLLTQRFKEAMDSLQQLLAVHPDDSDALGVLALCQLDSGDSTAAAGTAKRTLALSPGQLEALIVAGSVELAGQRIAMARKLLESAVQRHPSSGRLWSLLAQAQFAALDFGTAKDALQRAVSLMPNHIGTWHLLAWIQICTGRTVEARSSLERAMEIDRNFGETHGGLAVVAALEGREADAEASIRRARRLNPEGFAGPFAETLLLERAGRSDEARAIIDRLLGKDSPVPGRSFRQLVTESIARHAAAQGHALARQDGKA